LSMGSGYVLDFNDASFGAFFRRLGIDIHDAKYQTHGTSKAKKLRGFWDLEPDPIVARALAELVNRYKADCELEQKAFDAALYEKCQAIVARLAGKPPATADAGTEDAFLKYEFNIPNLNRLPVIPQAAPIIAARLDEARRAMQAKAHLSVIFLCGSVLEAVLLGAAQSQPEKFNRSKAAAKDKAGNVKSLHEWHLSQLIDAACEIGLLKPDVQKFSHGLRDFRNYIHPYEQMLSNFAPDEHTAKVCFHVLKAALASVAGERP